MRESLTSYDATKKTLLYKVQADFDSFALKSDTVIIALFKVATEIEMTGDIFDHAHRRHLRGDPPAKKDSKKDSIGDAINWECLLTVYDLNKNDIWIVAEDKDWRALNKAEAISPFLAWEWKDRKGGVINYHRSLTTFFSAHFPHIKLATQRQKEKLIEELRSKPASQARDILSTLLAIGDFTDVEVLQVVDAVTHQRLKLRPSQNLVSLQDALRQVVRGRESLIDTTFKQAYLTLISESPSLLDPVPKEESPVE